MTGLVLALLVMQGQAPELTAAVDRSTVAVGEEVLLTIRATTRSDTPLRIQVPSLDGFQLISRSERTEVAFDPNPRRSTVVQIRLRSTRVGIFALDQIHALQGPYRVDAATVTIEVIDAKGAVATALNPRVARLLARGPPASLRGEVGLEVVASSNRVTVGQQVDIVTVAWIPRELRLRLRRPPTLEPPRVEGMWSYPQPAPVGIAASRMVGGVWYDLFIAHEIVFPLAPGEHTIEPATLRYSVPLALQFFSQEERLSLSSDRVVITAVPLPDAPDDYSGSVGQSLLLERTVEPSSGRAGEPLIVDVTLAGEGNLALWADPAVRWPPGVRAYPDQTEERIQPVDGRIAGTKRFRYSLIPDSAGTMLLPPIEYSYFDARARVYRRLRVPSTSVAIAPAGFEAPARALPPPLLYGSRAPLARTITRALPWWVWMLLALLPVLGAALVRIPWSRLRRRGRPPPPPGDRILEAELTRALRYLVPESDAREEADLRLALVMSGVEPPLAQRLVDARARLRQSRYAGPAAQGRGGGDPLAEEVRAVLAELGAQARIRPRPEQAKSKRSSPFAATLGLALVLGAVPNAVGQTPAPSAEALYETGSLGRAARGFAERVVAHPDVPAHWYNLGAAYYRLGEEARAQWAWTMGARLAPRNGRIRRALQLVPPPDNGSARLLAVPSITQDELFVIAVVLWLVGWVGLAFRPALARRWSIVLLLAAAAGLGALGVERSLHRPLALVVRKTPLRLAPHERGPELSTVQQGTVVRLETANRGWRMVRTATDETGWLRRDEFLPLRPLGTGALTP